MLMLLYHCWRDLSLERGSRLRVKRNASERPQSRAVDILFSFPFFSLFLSPRARPRHTPLSFLALFLYCTFPLCAYTLYFIYIADTSDLARVYIRQPSFSSKGAYIFGMQSNRLVSSLP